jgi:hypothetical protein
MEKNRSPKKFVTVKAYCLSQERAQLQASARAARKSLSNYLLHVGLGYQVRGILDHQYVEELIRINGDLGRLGGLFKLWLINDERTAAFGTSTIRAMRGKIEATQDELRGVIRAVIVPSAEGKNI